jgi:hypothetical protein
MRLGSVVLLLLCCSGARAEEPRTAVKLDFETAPQKRLDVWVTRARGDDGGLTIKLIAKGVGPRPQALTVYSGGGDDDGPGDDDLKSLKARVVDLPVVGRSVRVDFTYKIGAEETTETTLVGFAGKTHRLLDVVTRRARPRNPHCAEAEETALSFDAVEVGLVATTRWKVVAAYGDDDLPVDKSCRAPRGATRELYRYSELQGKFLLGQFTPAPSPSPSPTPAAGGAAQNPDGGVKN